MPKVKKKSTVKRPKLNGARPKAKAFKSSKKPKVVALKKLKKSMSPAKPAKAKATRSEPVKLTAEMSAIRLRLIQMLSDLRKDIDHEVRGASERDLAHINDTSDMASDSAEGDLALRIAESETVEAGEIERAIEKIDNGTYGSCEVCNKNIGAERLQFLPFATNCIACQALAEIRKREEGDELDDLAEGSDDSENN